MWRSHLIIKPRSFVFRNEQLVGKRSEGRCLCSIHGAAQKEGFQSIGSFHSADLADLLKDGDACMDRPDLPFSDDQEEQRRWQQQERQQQEEDGGRREAEGFLLNLKDWTFLNHGAFGAALSTGYHRSQSWRRYLEEQPLRFFDRDLLPHLAYSASRLADFVRAGPDRRTNATLIQNATTGLNSVLGGYANECRSTGRQSRVIVWDTSYGSVKKMARHYCGASAVTEIPFQTRYLPKLATATNPNDVFLEALGECLDQKSGLRDGTTRPLLVLDHTTSNTALTMPIAALAAQAKRLHPDLLVLVDGAHGLLAQDLNIRHDLLNCVDFYVTNGHKWLCAPRGVGMLYARSEFHDTILRRPAIISHGVDDDELLLSRFVWDGCRDYAAALALPAVLDYWEERGPATVRARIKETLRETIRILAEAWHPGCSAPNDWPGVVTLVDFDHDANVLSPMALVRLPMHKFGSNHTSMDAKRVQDYLHNCCRIEIPVKCINGTLYVRVSCHVYNRPDDGSVLAKAILQIPS